MANTCKYYKQQKYVSYDSGNTWSPLNEYRRGDLYEEDSADCGYVVVYKWEVISGYTCSGCTKYQKTQKYVSYDGGTTWSAVSPAEYGIGDVIEQGSEDCGCSTQYRWVVAASEYICSGTSKYTKEYYQVSYDGGSTWQNVVPQQTRAGELIESGSTDCGYIQPIYRTLSTATTCVGYDKYTLAEYQVSYDEGFSWSTTATSATTLIEAYSEDCGYAPQNYKVKYKTISDDEYTVLCDEECPDGCIICRSELIGIPDNSNAALLEMEIGDCVKQIGGCCEDFIPNARNLTSLTIGHNVEIIEDNAFYSCVSLSSIFIPNSVKKIGANAFRSINADITIGTGVTFIGSAAFAYADRPHSITILATTPPTLDTSGGSRFYPFDYTNNIPIYVPAESVNAYKSADVWRNYYASRIQAIPNS